MSLANEYKTRAIIHGLLKSTFYICGQCKEITESVDYIDKCISCKWEGEFQEASTHENAEKIITKMKEIRTYNNNKVQDLVTLSKKEKTIKRVTEKLRNIKEAIEAGIPPVQWRIQHLLTDCGVTIIASPPKQFKTFVAIHAALSVSSGEPFLGSFQTTQSPVLYIDEENGEAVLLRRFKQLLDGHHQELPSNIHFLSYALLKLDTEEGEAAFDHLLTELQPGLCVLDSMVRFLEGDEDKASDVRKVFETLKGLLDKHKISFIILHHTRKGNGTKKIKLDDLRGSSDFGAFADAIVNLEPKDKGFEFRVLANRHVGLQEVQPIYIEVMSDRQQGPITFLNRGLIGREASAKQELLAWFREERLERFIVSEALKRLETKNISRAAFYEAREQLLSDGSIVEHKRGIYTITPGTYGVEEQVRFDP